MKFTFLPREPNCFLKIYLNAFCIETSTSLALAEILGSGRRIQGSPGLLVPANFESYDSILYRKFFGNLGPLLIIVIFVG